MTQVHSLCQKLRRCQRGYTVIEVIVTILFVGLALPSIILLFTQSMSGSAEFHTDARALRMAEQKIEQILADRLSPTRGYNWVTAPGRYPSESLGDGFTRTTTITTAGKVLNGVAYAEVVITVSHALITPVQIETWITRY
jgi:type II secretory pathway pseudopilin PulG